MCTIPDFPSGRETNAPNFVMPVTFPSKTAPTASSILFVLSIIIFLFAPMHALLHLVRFYLLEVSIITRSPETA